MPIDNIVAMGRPADEAEPQDNPAEEMAEPTGAHDPTQDCVPLDILAMPDETEQMEPPAVGDKVQYSSEGTVDRIEGGKAYVTRTTINGQKIEGKSAPEAQPVDDMAALENEAKGMSETPQY